MSEIQGYQKFFAELKRRHVFRVAAVYGATAFVVVQVADVLQEALRLPEAFLTGVAVLALLGFPIAIVMAWAYERTPQGVVRTGVATTQEIAEIVAQPASRRWPSGLLALVGIVALAAAAWLTLVRQPTAGGGGAPGAASIAVLPFANLSGDEETQPFVDGIHDDLLTQLSKIGSITVISRTSVQEYRNTTKNVRDIAAELGVSTVLEGGVQRSGDQYRINVQLIDAATDTHLWAERYGGELTTANIFDVQTNIATSIADALEASLTAGERASLERLPTQDLEAYELYRQAREHTSVGTTELNFRTADRLIDRAIERDSSFAEAYALKSIVGSYLYWFFYDRSDSLVAAADDLSRRALELAPGLAEGHWARGHFYYRTQLDYDRAFEEVRLVQQGRPGDGEIEGLAGDILRRKGDMRGAVAHYERAVKLAPRDAQGRVTVGETYLLTREYPKAEASLLRAMELRPDLAAPYHRLAQLQVLATGDTAGARRWLEEARDVGVYDVRAEFGWFELALLQRTTEAAVAAKAAGTADSTENQFRYWPPTLATGLALRLGGNSDAARAPFDSARVVLEAKVAADPMEPRYRSALGLALAGLGRNEEAIREGEEGLRLMPPEREAWRGSWRVRDLAWIYTMTGRHEQAIERLEYLLSIPSEWTPWELRLDPAWDPLRGNPSFQALVAER